MPRRAAVARVGAARRATGPSHRGSPCFDAPGRAASAKRAILARPGPRCEAGWLTMAPRTSRTDRRAWGRRTRVRARPHRLGGAPPQRALDGGEQVAPGEGLGDEGDGDRPRVLGVGAHQDDGQVPARRAQPRQQRRPAQARHHDVGQHQVGRIALDLGQRREAVGGQADGVAGAAEDLGEQPAGRRVVVGDEDGGHGRGPPGRRAGRCGPTPPHPATAPRAPRPRA